MWVNGVCRMGQDVSGVAADGVVGSHWGRQVLPITGSLLGAMPASSANKVSSEAAYVGDVSSWCGSEPGIGRRGISQKVGDSTGEVEGDR